ncbi:hypothetical protein COXBURSA331_A0131 [Coxiella burnetii RSA 331]|nr:hypothetical protein COXBURSA331_A0131 [Coxiella burnetii RSA 331]
MREFAAKNERASAVYTQYMSIARLVFRGKLPTNGAPHPGGTQLKEKKYERTQS